MGTPRVALKPNKCSRYKCLKEDNKKYQHEWFSYVTRMKEDRLVKSDGGRQSKEKVPEEMDG